MTFRTMGAILASLSIALAAGPAKALIFYDWAPDPGSAGSGFIAFSMSIPDPANFASESFADLFFFDFEAGGVPVEHAGAGAEEVDQLSPFSAVAGVLTSGQLRQGPFYAETVMSFAPTSASCDQSIADGDDPFFCTGSIRGVISRQGSWQLRVIPEPSSFPLLGLGLAALGSNRLRRHTPRFQAGPKQSTPSASSTAVRPSPTGSWRSRAPFPTDMVFPIGWEVFDYEAGAVVFEVYNRLIIPEKPDLHFDLMNWSRIEYGGRTDSGAGS